MENTKGEDSKGGEDFWASATRSHKNTILQGKTVDVRPCGAKNEGLSIYTKATTNTVIGGMKG